MKKFLCVMICILLCLLSACASACTGIYIGRKVSADGDIIIGRAAPTIRRGSARPA